MDRKITKQYRKEIWKQSLLDARELLGAKGEVVKLITQILLIAVAIGLIAGAGYFGWQGYESAVQIMLGLLVSDIVILIVVWLSTPIIARIFMWSTAAKRDEQQRETIGEYENTEDLAKAKNIRFDEVNSEMYSSIKVYNGYQKTFNGQLTLTKLNGKPLETVLELGMFVGNYRVSKLEWYPTSARLIEFASVDKDSKNAFIISSEIGRWMQIKSGKYEVETQLIGMLDGHTINPKRVRWVLILDRENAKIELKKKGRK